MSDDADLESRFNQLLVATVGSGLLAILLLPIGLYNLNSLFFTALWGLHLLGHAFTILLSVLMLWLLARGDCGRMLLGIAVILPATLFLLGLSSLPILERDALIYHLAVPKLWLQSGRVIELPWHEWSYFPMLLGMVYTGFLRFELVELTPFYHLSFLLLSSAVTGGFVYEQTKNKDLSLLGFLIVLTIPLCLKIAPTPMVDLGVSTYLGIALVCALRSTDKTRDRLKNLIIAGLSLGLAFSTKYVSCLSGVLMLALLLLYSIRSGTSARVALGQIAVTGLCALVVVSPWIFRNAVWTGNPFYPFLGTFFGAGEGVPFLGSMGSLNYRMEAFEETWFDILVLPVRILIAGEDDSARGFLGVLSPIFFFSWIPFFWPSARKQRWISFSCVFLALYFLFSIFLFHAYVRYLLPLLLVGVSLAVIGIHQVAQWTPPALRRVMFVLCFLVHGFFSVNYAYGLWQKSGMVDYLFGGQSKEDYLRYHLSEYSMIQYINSNISKDAQIYLLYSGNRYYYYNCSARGGYFSGEKIIQWIQHSASPTDLAEKFFQEGYSHIMLHVGRAKGDFTTLLNVAEQQRWTDFANTYTELLRQEGNYALLKLKK